MIDLDLSKNTQTCACDLLYTSAIPFIGAFFDTFHPLSCSMFYYPPILPKHPPPSLVFLCFAVINGIRGRGKGKGERERGRKGEGKGKGERERGKGKGKGEGEKGKGRGRGKERGRER